MPRNPTPAQQAAPRRNGARSYGARGNNPLANALLTHRVTAKTVCLAAENQETFQTLLNSLLAHFRPQVDAEFLRVETLASIEWRLRRLWDAERAVLDDQFLREPPTSQNEPTTTRLARAQRTLADSTRTVDRLQLQEGRLIRAYDRALAQLVALRKFRESREPNPLNPKSRRKQSTREPEPQNALPETIPNKDAA